MAKRRSRAESDSEGHHSDNSRYENPPSRKKKAQAKERTRHETPETAAPRVTKKPKSGVTNEETGIAIHMNDEGDQYVDLGKKRRVTVRKFRGQLYVDIREYYGDDGEEKPGKKGISLTVEQWQALKDTQNEIDTVITKLQSQK